MKTIVVKSVFLIVILLTGKIAKSQQQRVHFVLNYNTSRPVSGSFKDYVSKLSYRGAQAAVLYSVNTNYRIGVQFSYNDFYEKFGRQVYKNSDGSDISAVLSNTLQYSPLLIKGEYSPLKTGKIRPYAGLGAGLGLINYEQYLGEFPYKHFYTKSAFTGDIGLQFPVGGSGDYGFRISTSYSFSPVNEEGIKNIATWSGQAAVVIPFR